MSMKANPIDADDVIRRHASGEPIKQIARVYRVRTARVSEILRAAGVRMSNERVILPAEEIARRYLAGESEKALAESFGTQRFIIRRHLLQVGVTPRGRSEAMYTRMAQTTPEDRKELAAAAHEAVRGRPVREEHRVKMAKTRELRQSHVSADELLLQRWLADRGIESIPQKAVGRYNLDLAVGPVAVEIHGGAWHMTRDPIESIHKRFRYILDEGWTVLVIWVDRRRWPLRPEVADHVVTLMELAGRDPSARGQYWMVRGNGEAFVACGDDLDKLAYIPSFRGAAC